MKKVVDLAVRGAGRCTLVGTWAALAWSCQSSTSPREQESQSRMERPANEGPKSQRPQTTAARPSYEAFPDGYGYMQNLKSLQRATDDGTRRTLRAHAWKLWAGIMQPSTQTGWPLWFTWGNTTRAFPKPKATTSRAIKTTNRQHLPKRAVDVSTHGPAYPIPEQVLKAFPGAICRHSSGDPTICDGRNFQFNGDIMIATESLSKEAAAWIVDQKLNQRAKLDEIHKEKGKIELPPRSIATKHMYWPVKSKGVTGLPVWQNNFPTSYPGYAGYEKWETFVALDPKGAHPAGATVEIEFLYGTIPPGAKEASPPVVANAVVHRMEDFYFHQITDEDWKVRFDDADKAILTAASLWANGEELGVGDYLVSVAMHINTKELPSWTLQSVWWSNDPRKGEYSTDRPTMPPGTKGPWEHYLLTDAYAVPPNDEGKMDVAVNPYIEGVTHPIATSCRNCHVRAGWPTGSETGKASYQNPDCPDLLMYLEPETPCLQPTTRTDYLWIIPDRAVGG